MPMSGRPCYAFGRLWVMSGTTDQLPWDSPRWGQLSTRMGHEGERVRDELRPLSADPSRVSMFTEIWPEICSEGTTYDVAFAAAPYLVEFAQRAATQESNEYLVVLGLIATDAEAVPADLQATYAGALKRGLALALERLSDCPIDHTLRYLLATVAALRDRADLASVLQDLDAVSGVCQACGTDAFPTQLQDVTRRDRAHEQGAST
jgi:hypothetical protein